MEKKNINLEEILNETSKIFLGNHEWISFENLYINLDIGELKKFIKSAMLEACFQSIELAAENAEAEIDDDEEYYFVNKDSILKTKNQIE